MPSSRCPLQAHNPRHPTHVLCILLTARTADKGKPPAYEETHGYVVLAGAGRG